ncbi:MAG TPA: helix-turn-helix domain-containing protein [Fimbriimonas sp.]|nr:helix-turn-helix domain-containing protein [Fimbriimonas sp.]
MQSRLDMAVAIMQRRRELGLSHSDLATKLGTSTKFVYEIENGRQTVTLVQLEQLFSLLELEVSLKPVAKAKASKKA